MIYIVSVLPILILGYFIYTMLPKKASPIMMISLFMSGFLSVLLSFLLRDYLAKILPAARGASIDHGMFSLLVYVFMGVALTEEISKWVMTLLVHKEKRFEKILLATFISLGFATFENLIYIKFYEASLSTILLRGVTAVVLHTVVGLMMGLLLSDDKVILGLIVPVIIHGMYDLLLVLSHTYNYAIIAFGIFFSIIIIYIVREIWEISREQLSFKMSKTLVE